MNLIIDIKEDEKLRKEIKDMVRGAVKSVVREEIKNVIIEVVGEESDKRQTLKQMMKEEVGHCAEKALGIHRWNSGRGSSDVINEMTREAVDSYVREFALGVIRDSVTKMTEEKK